MVKAVCDSNFDEIERLVKKEGFDLNGTTVDKEDKFSAQALAAYLDNLEVLHLLDLLGADISSSKGKFQFTPLQAAESRWNVRVVDYLMERGVNPFVKDSYGFTAKEKAKLREHKTIASMLNAYEQKYRQASQDGTTLAKSPFINESAEKILVSKDNLL